MDSIVSIVKFGDLREIKSGSKFSLSCGGNNPSQFRQNLRRTIDPSKEIILEVVAPLFVQSVLDAAVERTARFVESFESNSYTLSQRESIRIFRIVFFSSTC